MVGMSKRMLNWPLPTSAVKRSEERTKAAGWITTPATWNSFGEHPVLSCVCHVDATWMAQCHVELSTRLDSIYTVPLFRKIWREAEIAPNEDIFWKICGSPALDKLHKGINNRFWIEVHLPNFCSSGSKTMKQSEAMHQTNMKMKSKIASSAPKKMIMVDYGTSIYKYNSEKLMLLLPNPVQSTPGSKTFITYSITKDCTFAPPLTPLK